MLDRRIIKKMDKSEKLVRRKPGGPSTGNENFVCPVCGSKELFPCEHFFCFDLITGAAYYWLDPGDTENFDID